MTAATPTEYPACQQADLIKSKIQRRSPEPGLAVRSGLGRSLFQGVLSP